MRFIPGIQGWFNLCETINKIYLINKLKNKNHMIINRCRKTFWQISTSTYDKNSQKRGIEATFLNTIKAIYDSSVQLLSCVWLCDPMNRSTHPCPSPTPRVYPNPCPLSQWCHPTILSSVVSFSSCPQSFPASGSFQMSQLFVSGGQSIGVSASTSVLPMNTQDWLPLGWTG